jgi:hypothetical protein
VAIDGKVFHDEEGEQELQRKAQQGVTDSGLAAGHSF